MFSTKGGADDSYAISYIIFSNDKDTQDTYKALSLQPNVQPTNIFNFHALEYSSIKPIATMDNNVYVANASSFAITSLQNVLIYAGFSGIYNDSEGKDVRGKIKTKQPNVIPLAQAGLKHLQKVGNPGR